MTLLTARQTTDSVDVEDIESAEYDEAPIEVTDTPRAKLTVADANIQAYRLAAGKKVQLKRGGANAFPGIITTSTPKADARSGRQTTVNMVHEGYHLLRRLPCTDYDFDEDGNPATTRDGVTVNPWVFSIYREPNSGLDAYSNGYPVHGINTRDGVRAMCGTRFVYQHKYEDLSHFLASSSYGYVEFIGQQTTGTAGGGGATAQHVASSGDTVYSFFGTDGGQDLSYSKSTDGARSFGTVTVLDNGGAGDNNGAFMGADAFDTSNVLVAHGEGASATNLAATYTSNGGTSWSTVQIASATNPIEISTSMASASVIYVAAIETSGYTIYKSSDGGASWASSTTFTKGSTPSISIHALDASNVFFIYTDASNYPTVSSTSNGGTSWSSGVNIEAVASSSVAIRAVSASELVATYTENAGDNPVNVGRSSNGGTTWATTEAAATSDNNSDFGMLRVIDANTYEVYYNPTDGGTGSGDQVAALAYTDDDGSTYSTFTFTHGNNGTLRMTTSQDTRYFTNTSSINGTTHTFVYREGTINLVTPSLSVYRDAATGDLTSALQRIRKNGSGFHDNPSGEELESIPLMNGDPNVKEMGAIGSVSVTLIGEQFDVDDPVIDLCADAALLTSNKLSNNTSRNYTSVSLTQTDNYNGSALTAWTGTVDLTAATRAAGSIESIGYRIRIEGSDADASTTKIYYISITATTASDVGLTEGTAEVYSNGSTLVDSEGTTLRGGADAGNEEDWIQGDFLGMRRQEAIERIRKTTESDAATNTSPHWDFHVDADLAYHWQERRGSDKTREYSFDAGNLLGIEHVYDGEEVAYQTIAYGSGSGSARTRIVNKREFSAGGLYDSDRDPTTGSATEVELANCARVMEFVDSEEKSILMLNRKSRASHKLHRAFIQHFKGDILAEHIRFFETGDGVLVKNFETRTNATLRVTALKRRFTGRDKERLSITFGDPPMVSTAALGASQEIRSEALTVRGPEGEATSGLAGNGIQFDAGNPGTYALGIQDGCLIDRLILKITTVPFVSYNNPTSGAPDIYVYDGDSGDGTGTPVFGKDIELSVDAPVDGFNRPVDFDGKKVPGAFGSANLPQTVEYDVTGYLRVDDSGCIASGQHLFFFRSATDSSNDNAGGLASVSVTPIIRFKNRRAAQ